MHAVVLRGFTKPKRLPTCPAYQYTKFPHISYTLSEDRVKFLCKLTNLVKCIENFTLSYKFPICMKSKFSSCESLFGFDVNHNCVCNRT